MNASNALHPPQQLPSIEQMLDNLFRTVNSHTRMYVDLHNKASALQADVNLLALEVNALRVRISILEQQ